LFGYAALEIFSKTPWWVIPLVYIPISSYLMGSAVLESGLTLASSVVLFAIGITFWTFIEYTLHRFLFHLDDLLPDHPVAFSAHFLFHGIHHFLPMDRFVVIFIYFSSNVILFTRLRLVMPPVVGLAYSAPIYMTVVSLLPHGISKAIMSGAYFGFMCYDMFHCTFYLSFSFHFSYTYSGFL
jgi:4-hydroxysphinganine ceramide fatty acyl 2-hydroxylase